MASLAVGGERGKKSQEFWVTFPPKCFANKLRVVVTMGQVKSSRGEEKIVNLRLIVAIVA